jgi:hypothetical protein
VIRHARVTLATSALAASAIALAAPGASAGEFTISACQADRGNFATVAFDDFATRGMRWKRACNPQGRGLRGLLTGNVVRRGRVARGARSVFVLDAPPGTVISRYRWSGHAQRRDCRYALQLYAERPGVGAVPIKNVRANRRCPRRKRAQAAGWPRPRTYDVGNATRIVQRVICVGAPRRRFCSARGANFIRTFTAQATVIDNSGPAVSVEPDNAFTRGEWVSGSQTITYDASDNAGVRAARAVIGARSPNGATRACNYAHRQPCPNGPGQIGVEQSQMDEGTQPLTVVAEDAAGNTATSAATTVRIDHTAPGAVAVGIDGGDAWRNRNDFDIAWANPPEGDRAPIASAHYRLCPVGGGECHSGARAGPQISHFDDVAVPAAGEWDLRLWRGDAAGNREPSNASIPVRLRFDPEPPRLGFEQPAANDPTKMSVLVEDRVSGLAGGAIEISRKGSGTWRTLATGQDGTRLVTRIDDASLPAGTYALRASARDQAGNVNVTDRRLDGQPMVVTLPLRVQTAIEAGKAGSRRVRRTVWRRGNRRKVWRKVPILRPKVRTAFGQRVRIAGRLTNRDGQPIGGAPIHVYSRVPGGAEQLAGTASTTARGRFTYTARSTSTRVLRFVHPGSSTVLPAQDTVKILTRSTSSLRVSKRRTLNGGSVVFSGRVPGRPLPDEGKLIEVQVHLSKGWQTFRTPRTDATGTWRQRYRFQNTCGATRFRFRALVSPEAGHPFEAGASRTVSVRVRGRPCPS